MNPNLRKKLLKMSKYASYCMLLQCIFCSFAFANISEAQRLKLSEIEVTVGFKNEPITRVFHRLEKQTDFTFAYLIDEVPRVTISIDRRRMSLEDILVAIAEQSNVSFRRVNETIHVKNIPHPEEVVEEIFVLMEVQGTVRDENNQPLPGATVLEKGGTNGTITDQDGFFRLNVSDNATLVFSFVGYKQQEIVVGTQTEFNVKMVPDLTNLDEVVVIGYGTVRKSDLTGSVSSINSEDFNQGVNNTVEQLIQGKVAGARVVANSGEPGSGLSISIRGASSINAGTEPLYVIDGLPVSNTATVAGTGTGFPGTRSERSPLNAINPSDIASIEILKDASATAIYGARGANGVILITTKKGKDGSTRVTYDTYFGVQNVAETLEMLNPQEYEQVINDIIDAGGGNQDEKVTEIANNGAGTNWQEEVFRENALVQNHNVSISAGNEKNQYFMSFNHQNQEGILKSSNFKRYSGRFNLDSRISDKFSTGLNMNLAYTKDNHSPTGYAINENGGVLYTAIYFDPTLPVFDEDGEYTRSDFLTLENPLSLVEGKTSYSNTFSMLGSVFGEYNITPELSVKVTIGGEAKNQRRDSYVSTLTQRGRALGSEATIINGAQTNYLFEGSATYKKSFGQNNLTALLGATTQKFSTTRSNQSAFNFATESTGTDNIGLGDRESYEMGSARFTNRLVSFLGRVNYSYHNRYLFTASFRADGSTRFGENNKFGYFPSFAAAWKLTEEGFMENQDVFSDLKLRASWGRTGNQEISNFQSILTFGAGAPVVLNDNLIVTLSPERLGNPDLKWETTEQWDIGVDFDVLDGRINGGIDYYQKSTYDMLIALPVPLSTGFQTRLSNVGNIKNSGFDFELNSVNIIKNDFSWNTTFILSTIKNNVEDLGGIPQIITGGAGFTDQIFTIEEGETLRSFYGWQIDGVWQEGDNFDATKDNVGPGDLKYRDVNGDSTVNSADRVILGNSFPSLTFAIGNTFTYKNLSLNIFIEGVNDVQMLNNNLVDTYFPIQIRRNKLAEPYVNRWTPDNPSDTYPSFVTPLGQGRNVVNSYTVEDASYVRLKTIRLDYTISKPLFGGAIHSANIYLSAENLITITDYSGIDPAVNSNGSANASIDFNTYPLARTFMAGLSITF